jgi:hypothetical protein
LSAIDCNPTSNSVHALTAAACLPVIKKKELEEASLVDSVRIPT